MKPDYWTNFWLDRAKESLGKQLQEQVLRIDFARRPVAPEVWNEICEYVVEHLDLRPANTVLDLCCGNGLLTREIASRVNDVVAVDLAPEFVLQIEKMGYKNVRTRVCDMRLADFPAQSFDRILLYSSLHYISQFDAVALFEKIVLWLKDGGVAFIGDVPDASKMWEYYDSSERRKAYFEAIASGRQITGYWFDTEFLRHLANYSGFSRAEVLTQPSYLPYNATRIDLLLVK